MFLRGRRNRITCMTWNARYTVGTLIMWSFSCTTKVGRVGNTKLSNPAIIAPGYGMLGHTHWWCGHIVICAHGVHTEPRPDLKERASPSWRLRSPWFVGVATLHTKGKGKVHATGKNQKMGGADKETQGPLSWAAQLENVNANIVHTTRPYNTIFLRSVTFRRVF